MVASLLILCVPSIGVGYIFGRLYPRLERQLGSRYNAIAFARTLPRWRRGFWLDRWDRKRMTANDVLAFTAYLDMLENMGTARPNSRDPFDNNLY